MDKFLQQMKTNWFIYGFIVAMILWYGNTNSRLNAVEAKQSQIDISLNKLDQLITDVAVVQTDVSYIKNWYKQQ